MLLRCALDYNVEQLGLLKIALYKIKCVYNKCKEALWNAYVIKRN